MFGILDSGIGGLSVYKQLKKAFPKRNFIYFGDEANVPYGDKTPEEITKLAEKTAHFLIEQGATSLIIACHTICVTSLEILKKKFSIPIVGMIEPTMQLIRINPQMHRVGILSTARTISSNVYQKAIEKEFPQIILYPKSSPNLVLQIESGSIDDGFVKRLLKAFPENIDSLLLLCTHFPLIQEQIQSHMPPNTLCLDPATCLVKEVRDVHPTSQIPQGNDRFIVSAHLEKFSHISQKYCPIPQKAVFSLFHL